MLLERNLREWSYFMLARNRLTEEVVVYARECDIGVMLVSNYSVFFPEKTERRERARTA